MLNNTNRIILKPEELQSVRACKKAIYNISKSTNIEPLELWQSIEEELRAQAATLKHSRNDRFLQAAITISAIIMIYSICKTEINPIGLTKESLRGIITTIPYVILAITAFKITWIPRLLTIASTILSIGFTLITTLLGLYSNINDNIKDFLHYLVGLYVYYVPPYLLLCGLLWWILTDSKKEQNSRKEELATLHATLPFLIQASRYNIDSRSDDTKHFITTDATSKALIFLILTESALKIVGLLHRTRI